VRNTGGKCPTGETPAPFPQRAFASYGPKAAAAESIAALPNRYARPQWVPRLGNKLRSTNEESGDALLHEDQRIVPEVRA